MSRTGIFYTTPTENYPPPNGWRLVLFNKQMLHWCCGELELRKYATSTYNRKYVRRVPVVLGWPEICYENTTPFIKGTWSVESHLNRYRRLHFRRITVIDAHLPSDRQSPEVLRVNPRQGGKWSV